MAGNVHPLYLRRALDLLRADSARPWTVGKISAACGVAPRTLQKHFHRFLGKAPLAYLRDLRLEKARQALLTAPAGTSVAAIAARCGFSHFGRFASDYRQRYGEAPSMTMRLDRLDVTDHARIMAPLSGALDRPGVAVGPFDLLDAEAHQVSGMAAQVAAALLRLHRVRVSAPDHSRYRLRGKVRGDGRGRLRVTVILTDESTGRHLWADHWDGTRDEAFAFEERVAGRIARAVELTLRHVETERAIRRDVAELNAWELAMRAMPDVLSYKAPAAARALELLERAMELAPHDPLPLSLAAWCHGVRACLHFTPRPRDEREKAHRLSNRAAALNTSDALTETILASGYTLSRDLEAAAVHADRAIILDGGSALAWARWGWISNFNGNVDTAIERLQIARKLGPADPVACASASFGIASAHFQAGRLGEASRWIRRGIAERPDNVGMSPFFLVSAHALENRKEDSRQVLTAWKRLHPDMTIEQVQSGWPFQMRFMERVAEGLESAGMRLSA